MYGKYFASTFSGSMVGAGSAVFAVWGYVIANCRDGSVELNPRLLAMILGDKPESIQGAVDYLCAPDAESRTKEHEGRRLLHSGAFLYEVPNHATYRKILNEDERREYFRVKKQEERQRKKALTLDSQRQSKTVKDMSTVSTQSESDPDSEKPPKAPLDAAASPPLGGSKEKDVIPKSAEALSICELFNRRPSTEWDSKLVRKFKDGVRRGVVTLSSIGRISAYYAAERAKGEEGRHRRDIGTFLNNLDGEIDRAEAFISANGGTNGNGNGAHDDPRWWDFLTFLNRPGEWTMKTAPDYLHGDFRKWKEANPV